MSEDVDSYARYNGSKQQAAAAAPDPPSEAADKAKAAAKENRFPPLPALVPTVPIRPQQFRSHSIMVLSGRV